MEVDIPRNRVGLVHAHERHPRREGRRRVRASAGGGQPRQERGARADRAPPANNAMAALFANASN